MRSAVSANVRMSRTFKSALSGAVSCALPSAALLCSTAPSFSTRATWVCVPRISTRAVWPPAPAVTITTRFSSPSTRLVVHTPAASRLRVCSRASSVTPSSTASSFSASPPVMPSSAATLMPRSPPEFGTVTPFTFFTMLPLQATFTFCGIAPSTLRARAPAYAMAMGSVQPSATISSFFRMRT